MMSWLAVSIGFVAISGLIGITTKLRAARAAPDAAVPLGGVAYAITGATAIAAGVRPVVAMPGTGHAVATGALAAAGLSVRFVALRSGDVSKVIPVTAAYPAVSLVVAAVALAEPIDAERLTGTALIVLGVAILGQP